MLCSCLLFKMMGVGVGLILEPLPFFPKNRKAKKGVIAGRALFFILTFSSLLSLFFKVVPFSVTVTLCVLFFSFLAQANVETR